MKTPKLTEASMTLLLAIAKDLPNWENCSPAYSHTDAVIRGNLTDLKKKKLVASFKDDGKEWLTLTDAGKKLAALALGESAEPVATKAAKKVKATAKKAAATKAPKLTKEKVFKPSWLVARFRNALHKARPELKKGKTLKEVASLSDIKAALQMVPSEWDSLLASFFNLGGKLEEAEGWE